jgi:hypothetical protein
MSTRVVWNKVTRFSQLMAILIGLLIFKLGFYFGTLYELAKLGR